MIAHPGHGEAASFPVCLDSHVRCPESRILSHNQRRRRPSAPALSAKDGRKREGCLFSYVAIRLPGREASFPDGAMAIARLAWELCALGGEHKVFGRPQFSWLEIPQLSFMVGLQNTPPPAAWDSLNLITASPLRLSANASFAWPRACQARDFVFHSIAP